MVTRMVKPEIAAYLEQAFLFQFGQDITDATDLFRAGIVDSQGYVQLMQFIQRRFQIKFAPEELLSAVITSLSGIVAAVEAKLAAKARSTPTG